MTSADRGVRSDASLEALGWVRRHLTDPERAEEAAAIYAEAGYEVRIQRLEPRLFSEGCQGCAATVCASCVVVYTRKPGEEGAV